MARLPYRHRGDFRTTWLRARQRSARLTCVKLLVLLVLACGPAGAQVTIDRRALDPLAPATAVPTPAPAPAPAPGPAPGSQRAPAAPRPPPRSATPLAPPPAAPAVAAPAVVEPPAPVMPLAPDPPPVLADPVASPAPPQAELEAAPAPPPLVPLDPPPPPVIPPPLAVPARSPLAPAPVEIAPDAPGVASRIGPATRVTFGAGRTDLNAATASAIREVAAAMPADATVTVTAFAAGTPQDPSTARRLSLSRALVVRSVLITAGIASPRVIIRSLGASQPAIGSGPPDRVDIAISPTSSTQAKPAP